MLFFRKHFENMLRKMIFYFFMSRNRLRNFGVWIVIPIMVATMTDKNAAELFDFLDQIAMFHASSSSA